MASAKKANPGKPARQAKKPSPPAAASGRAGKPGSGARRKPKPGRKKPGQSRWPLFLTLGLALLVLAAGLVFFRYQPDSAAKIPPVSLAPSPPASQEESPYSYEEAADPRESRLHQAIYRALEQSGLAPEQSELWTDIKEQGGTALRLEVGLNPDQSLAKTAEQLERELKQLGQVNFSWQKQDGFWQLRLFAGEAVTWQINLRHTAAGASPGKDPLILPPRDKPKVAISVDDVGLNRAALRQLLELNLPLTLSVLPYASDAPQVARQIKERGFELWLHLPMEPLGANDPGPGALRLGADKNSLIRLTRQALSRVPGAVGVNNHMGSRFTQSAEALAAPLQVLKENNLLFLDSLTSPRSVAYAEARRMGLRSGRRDIFLDHQVDEESIFRQLQSLLTLARSQGQAIAICHPHAATIKVLRQNQDWLKDQAEMIFASQAVN
jgi:polysaccharide deacetylase 2 family uncharacterized protein YibQ